MRAIIRNIRSVLPRFEVKQAKTQAERVGPHTRALVNHLLDREFPLKYLRRVQGILRLVQSGQVRNESLEHAANLGLTFKKTTHNYIKSTALHFQMNGNRPVIVAPKRDATDIYLHGLTPEGENHES